MMVTVNIKVNFFKVYVLGAMLPWRVVCLVCALLPGATCVIMPLLPETPTWLASKGRSEEATKVDSIWLLLWISYLIHKQLFSKALRWLRGPEANVTQELSNMLVKAAISSSKVADDPSTQVSIVGTSNYDLNTSNRDAKVSWQDETPALASSSDQKVTNTVKSILIIWRLYFTLGSCFSEFCTKQQNWFEWNFARTVKTNCLQTFHSFASHFPASTVHWNICCDFLCR